MNSFIPMDPNVAAKLIEGHEDTLTDKVREEQKFFDSLYCPRCNGSSIAKELDITHNEHGIKTRYFARCRDCRCLFDPDLGLLIEMGNLANIEPAIPIIHGKDD